jgi:hypothetical protein
MYFYAQNDLVYLETIVNSLVLRKTNIYLVGITDQKVNKPFEMLINVSVTGMWMSIIFMCE